jgi:hypothetical protein
VAAPFVTFPFFVTFYYIELNVCFRVFGYVTVFKETVFKGVFMAYLKIGLAGLSKEQVKDLRQFLNVIDVMP